MDKPKLGFWLWLLAFLLMVAAAAYQRQSGPTNPLRGSVQIADQRLDYRLPRSAENTGDAKVAIPDLGVQARVLWRHYPSDAPFTVVIMGPETIGGKNMLTANIPPQEAASKVEYKIEVGNESLPGNDGAAIMRFKGPVPMVVLLLHVILMFAAMLTSARAGLGAAFGRAEGALPWATLGLVLVGGIFFGALVAKAAFGSYWSGWPYGRDLTDNKTLLMSIAWLAACLLLPAAKARRAAVVAAAALTILVYMIPHSFAVSRPDGRPDGRPGAAAEAQAAQDESAGGGRPGPR
jgi:hypothetical protein